MVGEHLERTRGELAAVREAAEQAADVAEWAFPVLALRWSERQHLAELELGQALLADLTQLQAAPAGAPAADRQADGDAPTRG